MSDGVLTTGVGCGTASGTDIGSETSNGRGTFVGSGVGDAFGSTIAVGFGSFVGSGVTAFFTNLAISVTSAVTVCFPSVTIPPLHPANV